MISKETSNDGQLSYLWLRFAEDSSGRIHQIEMKRASYYREFEEEPGTNSFGVAVAKAK